MVVWDVPDDEVAELGRCLSGFEFVTLCYRRPRHLPQWSYNLFCMIHGRDREAVLEKFNLMIESCGLEDIPKAVLFSRRRFKQRGALYRPSPTAQTGKSSR
jgi:DNA-binding Lrp family transcriptional regulator